MSRYLIIGYGSMGKRHAANLRRLRPAAEVVTADPDPAAGADVDKWWQVAIDPIPLDGVIIASPATFHRAPLMICNHGGLPFFCEKPLGWFAIGGLGSQPVPPCAVGFQYRFNRAVADMRPNWQSMGVINFEAADNLTSRYGPTVAETMASHAFDLSLWTLGPATGVDLVSDGIILTGSIQHVRGTSTYDYNMAAPGGRLSRVNGIDLPHDEDAYYLELRAWLELVESGGNRRDGRLATFADGCAVDDIIRSVRRA